MPVYEVNLTFIGFISPNDILAGKPFGSNEEVIVTVEDFFADISGSLFSYGI